MCPLLTHPAVPRPGGQEPVLAAGEPDHAEDVALVRGVEPRHAPAPHAVPHHHGLVIAAAGQQTAAAVPLNTNS